MSEINATVVQDGQLAVATVAQSGEIISTGGEIDTTALVQTDNGKQLCVKTYAVGGGGSSDAADKSLSNLTDAGKIQVAHLAMPSETRIELSTGTGNTLYTAPADGYLYFKTGTDGNELNIYVFSNTATSIDDPAIYAYKYSGTYALITIPISKGFKFAYTVSQLTNLYFIYAKGSESEYTPS